MSIDLGNTPVGSSPTEEQKTQIRDSLSAFAPVAIGPIASSFGAGFSIYEDGNLAVADYPESITSITFDTSLTGFVNLRNLPSLTTLNASNGYGADFVSIEISGNQSIESIEIDSAELYVLDVSDCSNLTTINTQYCWNVSEFNFSNCTSLTSAVIGGGIGSLDFTSCSSLDSVALWSYNGYDLNCFNLSNLTNIFLYYSYNINSIAIEGCSSLESVDATDSGSNLTELSIDGCNSLTTLSLGYCPLYEASVNSILINLDDFGLSDGSVNLSSGEAPTGDGITAAANLVTKGWTVITS